MASSPHVDATTAADSPRNSVTFANVDFEGKEHDGSGAGEGPLNGERKRDDETTATRTASETKSGASNDEIETGTAPAKELQIREVRARGPSALFHPTNVQMRLHWGEDDSRAAHAESTRAGQPAPDAQTPDLAMLWRSRDNRKGRGSTAVPISSRQGSMAVPVSPRGGSIAMRLVFPLKDAGQNVLNMFTTFAYWDMAFWSGWSYTVGSVLFIVDGAWSWGPLAFPSIEWPGEETYGVPLCFFIGALFYQVGATMAYFEAINDGSFAGSAMKRFLQGHEADQKRLLDEKIHGFVSHIVPHHGRHGAEDGEQQHPHVDPDADWKAKNTRKSTGSIHPGSLRPMPRRAGVDFGETEEGDQVEYLAWRWWPTWHRLRTHHIYEIGYLSCAVQLFGATLYGMCGIVILPGILSSLSVWQTNAAYWIPQIVASVCFLVAGIGFTLETQVKWYKPAPGVLGWWIGLWAVVGSVGFLLCASLGPASSNNTAAAYQSDLSSMWGSAAYFLSSALQWYEAVNKHEVTLALNEASEEKKPASSRLAANAA